jgi:hypothetical protein
MLFYECSQFWCELVHTMGGNKVTMGYDYEPETKTKTIILIGYQYEVFSYPVP